MKEGDKMRLLSREYCKILTELKADSQVQGMREYKQHGKVSTLEHCESVARLSYRINKYLALNSDLKVLAEGAMLHDFYLYDWHHEDGGRHKWHGFTHAKTASLNAQRHFRVNHRVSQVIECHMWPLNLRSVPKSREAWIVCFVDKCISLYETLFRR